jgi:hypothetical protein
MKKETTPKIHWAKKKDLRGKKETTLKTHGAKRKDL